MVQKSLLITRPFYENPTNYLFHWSKPLIDLARTKRFDVIDLGEKKAVRKEIEGRLRKVVPNLVVFNGHGSEQIILGQDAEPLIIEGQNESLLSDTIVYTRACLSARSLGVSCIKKGVKAYIGYIEDFIFMFDPAHITRPLEDKIAELFLGPSNQVVRSLIKGNTARESDESGKKLFLKNIFRLLTSETAKEESETVRYLIWDMRHQICLGDGNAVV